MLEFSTVSPAPSLYRNLKNSWEFALGISGTVDSLEFPGLGNYQTGILGGPDPDWFNLSGANLPRLSWKTGC